MPTVGAKALGMPASCTHNQSPHHPTVNTVCPLSVPYLELSKGEATALADTAVVLDSRASHNGAELVEGTGGDGSSLSLTGGASRLLLAGLYRKKIRIPASNKTDASKQHLPQESAYLVEVASNPTLPILAEVCVRGQSPSHRHLAILSLGGASHGC